VTRHTIVPATTPAILGPVRRGSTVRLGSVSWHRDSRSGPTIHPAVRYQWLADGKPIAGATGSSWRVPATASWIGKFLRLQLTAKLAYSTEFVYTTGRVGGVK
jgi:hypothetical protein